MRTILLTAYDINPYKGSESGTGWNFVLQGARFNKIIAVTRKNNKSNIDTYIKENNINVSNIKFAYYDLPYYLRFWKKGARGSSLYFYLWQMFMPIFLLKQKFKYDILHNVNFHADAFPTFLWLLGKPLIWGPINHNEAIPKQYLKSNRDYLIDRIKWCVKNINWKLDPFMQLAKYNTDVVIGGNASVQKRLHIKSNKFINLSQAGFQNTFNYAEKKETNKFSILIAGRFLAIKSFDISILAFDLFYNGLSHMEKENVELNIIGKGKLEKELVELVNTLNSKNAINFIGWVDHDKMLDYYKNSSLFSFPSHEGAGMVVVEALSFGLPVVCFDNYGPGSFVTEKCAFKIPYGSYKSSVKSFSDAYDSLFKNRDLLNKMSFEAVTQFNNNHTWDAKGDIMKRIYESIENNA